MTSERIVFETSPERKEALHRRLASEGLSISDWLGDQLELMLEGLQVDVPLYPEITALEEIRDPSDALRSLESIDWAFAEEETLYLGHDLHPYPAKFIPQIPGHLISLLTQRGELVLDPFGGSGTTALEAARLGRRAVSLDANPLAALIGTAKTALMSRAVGIELRGHRAAVASRLRAADWDSKSLVELVDAHIPAIPNIDKWFPITSRGELGWLRAQIERLEQPVAKVLASLALSRVVLGASFQDSETRYASKPREIPAGSTFQAYLTSLDTVTDKVARGSAAMRPGATDFLTGDSRYILERSLEADSVDLVVTSPPYGNAMDYHLYHRFRLFWLGHDPRELGRIEIGSHLRHQRENSGFDDYLRDLEPVMDQLLRVLRPARYAAFLIGDSIYEGVVYEGASALADLAGDMGWEVVGNISRRLPDTRRSFAAKRATQEQLLLLRKPDRRVRVVLEPPEYEPWSYEEELRKRETTRVLGEYEETEDTLEVEIDALDFNRTRRLAFTSYVVSDTGSRSPTWQRILENGFMEEPGGRKNPKYATHGLHPYKGKFYPQLAKALLNLVPHKEGATLLDPFCGSGTGLLEGRLNGWRSHGIDMNPLAAKIARAKLGVLDVEPRLATEVLDAAEGKARSAPAEFPEDVSAFSPGSVKEIRSWFPEPVVYKMNWLLWMIRSCSAGILQEYLEVILSSIVRDISQQDPRDLRIRRRKPQLEDAAVVARFLEALDAQRTRLERWWANHGHCPHREFPSTILDGDARKWASLEATGVGEETVDLVLTSPPYATALPYIDTDRLSLLVLHGLSSGDRRPLERSLTGSREILTGERRSLEQQIREGADDVPGEIMDFVSELLAANEENDVGFRRQNRPSLLLRFFRDLSQVFANCHRALVPGGEAFVIIGDNTTTVGGEKWHIPTSDFAVSCAKAVGMELIEEIPIEVTTEDLKHIRHAIKENTILRFRRP